MFAIFFLLFRRVLIVGNLASARLASRRRIYYSQNNSKEIYLTYSSNKTHVYRCVQYVTSTQTTRF